MKFRVVGLNRHNLCSILREVSDDGRIIGVPFEIRVDELFSLEAKETYIGQELTMESKEPLTYLAIGVTLLPRK